MSHFSVAVITEPNGKSVEELLAPFHEFECTGWNDQYVVEVDETEELKNDYAKYSEGKSFKDFCEDWTSKESILETEEPDIEDVHKYGYIKVDKNGEIIKVIKRTNPNAKWDWWEIGGRWSGAIRTKNGKKTSQCKISDVDTSPNKEKYDHAIRFWEINVEKQEIHPEEDKEEYFNFYKPEYYLEKFGNKEAYAKHEAAFKAWAMITTDGMWHEQGKMGWWASNDATNQSTNDFMDMFNQTIASANPDHSITIVDCHI